MSLWGHRLHLRAALILETQLGHCVLGPIMASIKAE